MTSIITSMNEISLATAQRNLENVIVIWLDDNIVKICDDTRQSKIRLQQIINYLETFDDVDKCIDYITDTHDEKIFLIISGKLGEQLLPLVDIQNLTRVESVYIYCTDVEKHKNWAKNYEKVHGIFMDINLICEQVSKDMTCYSRKYESLSMNLLSSDFVELTSEYKDKQDASFMYAQLLKDLLIVMNHSDSAKKDMIDISRQEYQGNVQELAKINEFEKEYYAEMAVWWYTRDCFIYRILNRALRTQDIDVLYRYRSFIQDLHQQLTELHRAFIDKICDNRRVLTVYRGQCLGKEEFEKTIMNNIGGLLSINNFLSTTLDKDVAQIYAETNVQNYVQILFQIEIDVTVNTTPFASINYLSSIYSENEILFSMGTVFRILSVVEKNGVWIIILTLTDDEDQQLKSLMNHLKTTYCHSNNLVNLAQLMVDMGEYDQGEQFYQMLLNDTTVDNPADVKTIYSSLAKLYNHKGDLVRSIEHCRMSLLIVEKYFPQDTHSIAMAHSSLGLEYATKSDNNKAKKHLQKALDMLMDESIPDLTNLAFAYNNLATVYWGEENYSKALELLEKSLEISLKSLPSNHPSIGTRYSNIAIIHMCQKNYDKGIENFKISLEILLNSLPPHHNMVLLAYKCLAIAYGKVGRIMDEEEMEKKALEIEQKSLPPDYETLLMHYKNSGLEMFQNERFEEALMNFNKHMELLLKIQPYNYSSFTEPYLNITFTCCRLHKYEEALKNIKRAIEIETTRKPVDHEYMDFLNETRFQIEQAACMKFLTSQQEKAAQSISSAFEDTDEDTENKIIKIARLFYAGRHHRIPIPETKERKENFADF